MEEEGGRETEGDREKEAEWGRCLMSGLSVSMVGILLEGVAHRTWWICGRYCE